MVRYTAAQIFQILYYARREGDDIDALEAKYFRSQDHAHAEVDVSKEDAPTIQRIDRKMRQSQRCLAEEPWVHAFADDYQRQLQIVTLSQYALLASEAASLPRQQSAKKTSENGHSKRQSLTVPLDTPTKRGKGKDTSTQKSKESVRPSHATRTLVRPSGREILAVHHSSYISATLQFLAWVLADLFATETHKHYAIDPMRFKACTTTFEDSDADELARFSHFFGKFMKERSEPSGDAIEPAALLQRIEKLSKGKFGPNSPHTVSDFAPWLLTALLEGTRASVVTPMAPSDIDQEWYRVLDTVHHSPIVRQVGVHVFSGKSCHNCNSETQDQSYCLLLPLQSADPIALADVSNLPLSILDPEPGQCTCGEQRITQAIQIRSCSQSLIISVTPSTKITYPLRNLNISKVISQKEPEDADNSLYELQSVVEDTAQGYNTWCFYGENWWQYKNHNVPTRVMEFDPVSDLSIFTRIR